MNKHIIFLRISYWTAAIADFIIAILVLIPERMGLNETVFPMGLLSAIAFSWGILLIIADRKPLERKWVLIPTIIVVTLLTMTRIIFELNGKIELNIAFSLFGLVLTIFMIYSFYIASKVIKNK